MDENGRVIVTGCLGKDKKALKSLSGSVLAITGPHQYEAVLEAVRAHAPMPKKKQVVYPNHEHDIKLGWATRGRTARDTKARCLLHKGNRPTENLFVRHKMYGVQLESLYKT